MNKEAFNKAERLYSTISEQQYTLKGIRFYEQEHYKAGVPLMLKTPYTTGTYAVDTDIVIKDKELIKEVLNCIKIYSIKTIQNAEKELENL